MRLSDIAGCMMRLAKCGQMSIVASDRDVTEKGYEMLCPPLRWDCRYITLGVERLRSDGLPYLNSCGTWVQDFTLLSGRFFSNLFNPPIATSLPIPAWAQGEGISALIWRPHLVAHKGKLHLFYLIRLVGSYLPQCSVLCADTRGTSAATAVAGTRDADRHVDSVPMDQSQFVKAEDTGAELNNYSFCGDNVQFSLAHAVSRDDSLHTWSTVTESAPLLSCYSKAPLFTVASVPPLDFHTVGPGISPKRVAGPTENVLQLLWYEEDASEQWSAASPYISPTLCKLTGGNFGNRVPLPFQRWVNAHSDAEPECWEREPSYSSIRVDPDFMKSSVSSLSLYEHEGTVFVASVQQDAHQRTLLMSVPLTAEP
ncbi:hypothetical protein TRVL_01007 [Trypanosoma vivax]|nr:hypothetical protein TRVL_01007 [Trypanosoma vivax]